MKEKYFENFQTANDGFLSSTEYTKLDELTLIILPFKNNKKWRLKSELIGDNTAF